MADRTDPIDDRPMRGRVAQYEAVLGLLASTAQCRGKALLVEGDPGTRKWLLLATVGRKAWVDPAQEQPHFGDLVRQRLADSGR
jgi:hypothetical protein